jgi:hypothetical protein
MFKEDKLSDWFPLQPILALIPGYSHYSFGRKPIELDGNVVKRVSINALRHLVNPSTYNLASLTLENEDSKEFTWIPQPKLDISDGIHTSQQMGINFKFTPIQEGDGSNFTTGVEYVPITFSNPGLSYPVPLWIMATLSDKMIYVKEDVSTNNGISVGGKSALKTFLYSTKDQVAYNCGGIPEQRYYRYITTIGNITGSVYSISVGGRQVVRSTLFAGDQEIETFTLNASSLMNSIAPGSWIQHQETSSEWEEEPDLIPEELQG